MSAWLQVVDTVDLYHLRHQRKLSLRFLASYALRMDIQQVTHDSIEDARAAVLLLEARTAPSPHRAYTLIPCPLVDPARLSAATVTEGTEEWPKF